MEEDMEEVVEMEDIALEEVEEDMVMMAVMVLV